MKNPVVIVFALTLVASLLAGAWIVVGAPEGRVYWVLWPFGLSIFSLVGLGGHAAAEQPVIGRRPLEDL